MSERYIQPVLPEPHDDEPRHYDSPQQSYLGQLWDEYRLECDTRRTLGLPHVNLDEFAQMRDFSDRVAHDALYDAPETSPPPPETTEQPTEDNTPDYVALGRLGGQATFEKHGREHMAEIGRKGFQATADKYWGGDTKAFVRRLTELGMMAGDPFPWNGAHQFPKREDEPWEGPNEQIIFGDASVAGVETHTTDPIMERLQTSLEAAMSAEGFKAFLETQSKFHNYSPYNAMLIASQMPDATRVASYTTWQSLGRQVKRRPEGVEKGGYGIKIRRPIEVIVKDEESGEAVKSVRGFTNATVFDISQTDGPDLPTPPEPKHLDGNDPIGDEIFSRLKDFVTAGGVDVVKGPLYRDGRKMNGAWSPSHRAIVINHELHGDQEVKTFAHEVEHMVADHRDRAGIQDKETVAEAAAFVTLNHFGIDTAAYTFPYVTGWAQQPEVFKRNIDEIQKVANLLITAIGDGCPPAEK